MVKTKALISCTVTAQLICAFVFAYAKIRSPHDAAHMKVNFHQFSITTHVVAIHYYHLGGAVLTSMQVFM